MTGQFVKNRNRGGKRSSTTRRYFPAKVQPTKIEDPVGNSYETCTLYMGKGQKPHVYIRVKLSMKAILKGRRVTLPWRRIWIK